MKAAREGVAYRTRSRTTGAALFYAAVAGDAAAVRSCLQSGVSVNNRDPGEGLTALHAAADNGHTEVVELLLAAGADVAAATNQGLTALHMAAVAARAGAVAALLDAGADPCTADSMGFTSLHSLAISSSSRLPIDPYLGNAAASQREEVGRLLVQHGANLEAVNADGCTPLHCAAIEQDLAGAQVLVQLGAKVDAACAGGYTPLWLCVGRGQPALVRLLLSAGADVHKRCNGRSLLCEALRVGDDPGLVQILLDAGADYNAPMDVTEREPGQLRNPTNALSLAAALGRFNTFRLLRKAGARSSAATSPHDALCWAAMAPIAAHRLEMVKLLLADGADAPCLAAAAFATLMKVDHVEENPNPSELDYDMVALLAQHTNRMRLAASADVVSAPSVAARLAETAAVLCRLAPEKHAAYTKALLKGWSADTAETDAAHAVLASQQRGSVVIAAGVRDLLVQTRSAAAAAAACKCKR